MPPNKSSKPRRKQLLILCLIGVCLSLIARSVLSLNPVSTATNSSMNSEGPLGEARELMASADALRSSWKEADLRESLAKYDQAAPILTSIGDDANASIATSKAASVCFYLGEFAGALQRYKSAAAVA